MLVYRGIRTPCREICSVQLRFLTSNTSLPQTHQTIKGRKRFYANVDVHEVQTDEGVKYEIRLDGRTLRTPARNSLHFRTSQLAYAVALEWDSQSNQKGIEPSTMPLMTLSATTIDHVLKNPEPFIQTCLGYLATDTICFYAEESDRIILKRQKKHWGPIMKWMEHDLKMPLNTTRLMTRKVEHPEETTRLVYKLVNQLDLWMLAPLQMATMECKSLILGLALVLRQIDAQKAWEACRIEEEFQVEQWGLVEGGHDHDRVQTKIQLAAASTFLRLHYGPMNPKELQADILGKVIKKN